MTLQKYMGLSEAADCLGVTKQCLSNWMKRGKYVPKPVVILKMGPIWFSADIRRFGRAIKEQ